MQCSRTGQCDELLLWVPIRHRSGCRVQRIQLHDTCLRFLEETITLQFFCTICVMLLVLCFEVQISLDASGQDISQSTKTDGHFAMSDVRAVYMNRSFSARP